MAFKHGRSTSVWYGGVDMSPYLRGAELSVEGETADVTTYGDTWREHIPGLIGGGYEFEGLYDPADTTVQAALGSGSQVLTVCPGGGSAIGDVARLVPGITSDWGQSSPIDDAVAFSWGVTAEEAIAFGYVLHPLSEDTNTTTGAERDDGAATATGWTAHLHVTLVDGGSWVVKLQDAAVSNTYSDVTGGAFTAATGVTSQHLESSGSTTALRRYVRYVATRTGGSAGNGITFALAISRTRQ